MVCWLKYFFIVCSYYTYVYLDVFLVFVLIFVDFFGCYVIFREGVYDVFISLGVYFGIVNVI